MNFIQTESKAMLSYATQDQVEENWGLGGTLPTHALQKLPTEPHSTCYFVKHLAMW